MKEGKCAMCGSPILLCDACGKPIPKNQDTVQFFFNDGWGIEYCNFCSVECMVKWLFELAPTTPQREPEKKGAMGEVDITGLDRYKFISIIRKGVCHGS